MIRIVTQLLGAVCNDMHKLNIHEWERNQLIVEVGEADWEKLQSDTAELRSIDKSTTDNQGVVAYVQQGPVHFRLAGGLGTGKINIIYRRHLVGFGIG